MMRRFRSHHFKAIFTRTLFSVVALLLPQMAYADCPQPKTPPTGDNFYFCFDGSRISPQPIIHAERGPFLVVEVELNGHKLPALLDTGAGVSVVDFTVARDIGLKAAGPAQITALDGRNIQASKATINQLVIGGFMRKGGPVAISDLSNMSELAQQPFAMVVGADVLSQVALVVNRDNQSVIVLPNNARPNGTVRTATLRVQQPDNMFMTYALIDGRPITVRLDTGADDELILRGQDWTKIVSPTARTTTIMGFGLAGTFVQSLVRLNNVKIGDQSVGDAIANDLPTAASIYSGAVLGMGILSRFNLFLNPQIGMMVITQPQKPALPRRETMVGILGPPTDNGITIMHVMAHSPAEVAGLKPGDRICTVDGQKVSAAWAGTPKNDWMIGPEGKTVMLGRCDGGEVQVTLRRFY